MAAICTVCALALLIGLHTMRPRATVTSQHFSAEGGQHGGEHTVTSQHFSAAGGRRGGEHVAEHRQLNLWHVADWHLNIFHDMHGDVVDMCRSPTVDASRWPGAFGHWNCDPSRSLAAAAVAEMARRFPAPHAILLGGDAFGHVPAAREDRGAVLASHRAMHTLLRKAFPRTPVLPVLGNHDTWPYFSHDPETRQELARLWRSASGAYSHFALTGQPHQKSRSAHPLNLSLFAHAKPPFSRAANSTERRASSAGGSMLNKYTNANKSPNTGEPSLDKIEHRTFF